MRAVHVQNSLAIFYTVGGELVRLGLHWDIGRASPKLIWSEMLSFSLVFVGAVTGFFCELS